MCWFGFFQPYATSIIHDPEQEINPSEVDKENMIFIWDKYMKSDALSGFIGKAIPWSPALLEGYARKWSKGEDGKFRPELVKLKEGKCLGAALLVSRINDDDLKPLVQDYKNRGYDLKDTTILIGDLERKIHAFLP